MARPLSTACITLTAVMKISKKNCVASVPRFAASARSFPKKPSPPPLARKPLPSNSSPTRRIFSGLRPCPSRNRLLSRYLHLRNIFSRAEFVYHENKGTYMKLNRFFTVTLLATVVLAMSAASFAGVFISVNFGPPALPVYEQPPCPAEGYIWTPGYWAYGPYGYYWVPGTWVLAPQPGYLWTPGYWAWDGGLYYWHPGYWGPTVGYYGGIPYGHGYTRDGYRGGYWRDNHFYYNQSVNNVNVTRVTNVYNTTIINN